MIEPDQGVLANRRHGKRETREHGIMSKLRETIRDESRRRHGLAGGPLVVMDVFWEPVLSPTGDRIVGKRQTGARAKIVGDPHRRIWESRSASASRSESYIPVAQKSHRR
jgi:hypothetical protein